MTTSPIAYLRDDFTDNSIAPVWTAYPYLAGSATRAETGGQAVITLPSSTAGTHENGYYSGGTYDITGDGAFANVATMVSTSVAAFAVFGFMIDASNQLRWFQQSGTLKAQKIVAGVTTDLFTVTWSAATHKYLRIRESGGNILFDTSTNGTSWTNRHTTSGLPIAITALHVQIVAGCGNVASPGTFKLDEFNIILPALATNWHMTQIEWPELHRFRTITLAATSGQAYVATSNDGTTWAYWSGPLGSGSGGYNQLTSQASQAAAQAMAVNLPLADRWDLPTLVECRFIRLYHRSTSGSSYTMREYYARRLLQSDDLEVETILAINIGAGQVTADKIFVLTLGAITANIGQLNIDLTGYIWQGTGTAAAPTTGLKIYNSGGIGALSTYNATVEQIKIDTDGKFKAAAGAVVIDASGITAIGGSGYSAGSSLKFSDGTNTFGELYSTFAAGSTHDITLITNVVTGRNSTLTLRADAPTGKVAFMTLSATKPGLDTTLVLHADNGATLSGHGLNLGTATGAASGQLATSGSMGIGIAVQSNVRLDIKGASATNADYSFLTANSAGTTMIAARNDGLISIAPSGGTLQFFGGTGSGKPTITGSRGGNAALASFLTALASMGLITDSTTP